MYVLEGARSNLNGASYYPEICDANFTFVSGCRLFYFQNRIKMIKSNIVINLPYQIFKTRGCPFKFERGKALTRVLRDTNFTICFGFFCFVLFLFLFCLTQQPVAFRWPPVVSIVLLFNSVNRVSTVNTFQYVFLSHSYLLNIW